MLPINGNLFTHMLFVRCDGPSREWLFTSSIHFKAYEAYLKECKGLSLLRRYRQRALQLMENHISNTQNSERMEIDSVSIKVHETIETANETLLTSISRGELQFRMDRCTKDKHQKQNSFFSAYITCNGFPPCLA